jgi:hypothetical protein
MTAPEFKHTMKVIVSPGGRMIPAIRASERRTGDKGCSGWRTPHAPDRNHEASRVEQVMDRMAKGHMLTLDNQALLAAWPTPRTPTGGPETAQRKQELGRTESGGGDLAAVANLAAWPTPNTMEGGQTSRGGKRKGEALMGGLVGWPTPVAGDADHDGPNARDSNGRWHMGALVPGPASTSCPAGTGRRGVLRPGHSRWLMGYPAAWDSCGATGIASARNLRHSSSLRGASVCRKIPT